MTTTPLRGPIVIDTDVFSAVLVPGSSLATLYEPVIIGREAYISFQTAAEVRYGAMWRNWGPRRMRELERHLGEAETVQTAPGLIEAYAQLRTDCERAGHGLAQRVHNADRWIAATAIWLNLPLVAHDGIYRNAPGLSLETLST